MGARESRRRRCCCCCVDVAAGANACASRVKSGSGDSGGVCVCACGWGGDDRARDRLVAPLLRGETGSAVFARAFLPLPLFLGLLAVRGVIGLDPNANTRDGRRGCESRDRCDASRYRSITGAAGTCVGAGEGGSSRSRSRCRRACGRSLCELDDGPDVAISGAAIVPVDWSRRWNLGLGEPAGEGMSCWDRVCSAGVQSGCDAFG